MVSFTPITNIEGTCIPLRRSDVDTDQIIPSDWLKRVERTGFEKGLFSEWRDDPGFVLNDENYAGAKILVAGPNFGTGSSREHAVWALQQYGFQAVISSKFADIFKNNCTKCGLVPVEVSQKFVDALFAAIEAEPQTQILVDVEALSVEFVPPSSVATSDSDSSRENFHLDPATHERFLKGLDDIGLTLEHVDQIASYEVGRHRWLETAQK